MKHAIDGLEAPSHVLLDEASLPAVIRRGLLAAVILLCLRASGLAGTLGTQESPGLDQLLGEVRAALEAGELEKAVRAGEKAIVAEPRSSEAQDLLGRAYGLTAKDSQRGQPAFGRPETKAVSLRQTVSSRRGPVEMKTAGAPIASSSART
jgi:hypothetical protein